MSAGLAAAALGELLLAETLTVAGDGSPGGRQSGLLVCIADIIGLSIVAPALSPSATRERLSTMPARLAADYRDVVVALDASVAAIALQAHG